MEALEVLNRFNKLPVRNQATALFVGVKGIGKRRVANSLTECELEFRSQIRTATYLPLPAEVDHSRPRIDLIVFFIDMSNKASLDVVKESLYHVDIDYFLGHCCFVVTNVRNESTHAIDIQDIISLADIHDSPLLCAELGTKQGQSYTAKKLVYYLQIAAGFSSDVTPMLVDVTKRSFVQEEVSPEAAQEK